ncbi:MAG TPA: Bax inhibitor-1/YccA family protein [Roseiflexaceae bacterium]|nr:Bax inhibitor-1/YccA family protein [Roseiflexaceae bacterium]
MSYIPTIGAQAEVRQRSIMSQVYAWMTAGLLVTGAVAAYTANTPALLALIFGNPIVFWGLIIAEFGMVFALSAAIGRLSPTAGTALFLGYSALNGLTLAAIFLVYTRASIAQTFFVTAATFGAMSLYGYTTKRDLSTIGNLLVMALIGFFIGSIVNIFLASSALYWILTYAGIAIFIGLTAWDTQKIKLMSQRAHDDTSARRVAILGALMLYLDFINLFLLLLRLLGSRRS